MEIKRNSGFTLIELLVAVALGLVILAGLFRTFKVQQDSYVIQDQVSAMQQNLRAAMYMITRDLQMAGYYTNYDGVAQTRDWKGDGNNVTGLPLLFASNNVTATGDNIKDGTDLIVIVKASLEEGRALTGTENASGGNISLANWNLDGVSGDDLNTTGKRYGVLVKSDLYKAELFQLDSSGNLVQPLKESYSADPDPLRTDRIHRADIVIYKVDDSNPARPCLVRM